MSLSPYYQEEDSFSDPPSRLGQTPQHYEAHQERQSQKIQRQYERQKLEGKLTKSIERISHSGDARWGEDPMKALQMLKQIDNLLLGEPEQRRLTATERAALRRERQERLLQLSQPRTVHQTRFEIEETRVKELQSGAKPNNKAEIRDLLLNNPLGITIPTPERRKAARRARRAKKAKRRSKARDVVPGDESPSGAAGALGDDSPISGAEEHEAYGTA